MSRDWVMTLGSNTGAGVKTNPEVARYSAYAERTGKEVRVAKSGLVLGIYRTSMERFTFRWIGVFSTEVDCS
jgi:hypothetical protein